MQLETDEFLHPHYHHRFSDSVALRPWVGPNYGDGSMWRMPLLVLGDSHYDCGEALHRNFTAEKTLQHRCTLPFWRSITRSFLNKEDITNEDSKAFWDSIAFYNFVQESVGPDASYKPTKEMYANAIPSFREVLEVLKPRCIIVVCIRTWNSLPEGSEHEMKGEDIAIEDQARATWLYSIGDGKFASTSRVPHPSMRQKWDFRVWHPWIMSAIESARRNC